jgi:hypothetical protein
VLIDGVLGLVRSAADNPGHDHVGLRAAIATTDED